MPCPTCDHTMQQLGTGIGIYWCPRCGTLKAVVGGPDSPRIDAPKLVGHCRELMQATRRNAGPEESVPIMKAINESCHLPGDRL